ncbi:T9SS type A sorting domain-containing protein [Hymenobacter negativus]|uniref:T9SS type A sorting domain-containing protein n=1 Tax=Hymenobacter negativus TaxID=2795026 RepID=A0ABS3QE06_9BACT|nr:T9SS type A sorting domain-containing protein [Hymenobacter negativus]MBO2009233.1 T9SS type A sorting domain-containing protein [Hymenobacter negativus]
MKRNLLLALLASAGASTAAQAQSAIVLNQTNFPALASTVELYSQAGTGGVTTPTTGANQTWNYTNLTPLGQPTNSTYTAPIAMSPFTGTTRAYTYNITLGILSVLGTTYEALTATGLQYQGFRIITQRFGLGSITGSSTDSVVVPTQTVPVGTARFVFPTTTGTVNRQSYRIATTGLLTVGLVGLNRAPLRLVQRVSSVDSVAGWGTVRIPTATGTASAPYPALLLRRRVVEVDSFYLGTAPAPALLLAALNLQQGATTYNISDDFYRANSSQPLLSLGYPTSARVAPNAVYYSRETTVVAGTQPELAAQVGGLVAYPNPGNGRTLTLGAGNGSRQAVQLTVRDLVGRTCAQASAYTGEPTSALTGLPAGVYLVEAEATNRARSTVRVTVE